MTLERGREHVRVLLIEDDADEGELLQIELERRGLAPAMLRVDNEPALLDALEAEWDVIVSDYSMPNFDGMRAFELTRAHRADVPFIFVSGFLGAERAVEAMRQGACDYIIKGGHYSHVHAAIRREMATSRARRHRAETDAADIARNDAAGAGIFEYRVAPGGDDGAEDGEVHGGLRWLRGGHVRRHFVNAPRHWISWESFGRWLEGRLRTSDHERLEAAERDVRRGLDQLRTQIRLRDERDQWMDLEAAIEVVERAPDGKVRRIIGSLLDVTGAQAFETRSEDQMDAMELLASGMAHDFNNVLTVIQGFVHAANLAIPADNAARLDLDEIDKAAMRASGLTRQLLTFARQVGGAPRTSSPGSLVRDAESQLELLLGGHASLRCHVATDVWNVHVDPRAFELLLTNMVTNAREAVRAGGSVRIGLENQILTAPLVHADATIPPGEYVTLTIADDGAGMTEETRARIFHPFFSTKPARSGVGLGLSVCLGVVKRARGYLVADSELGSGTTFRIFFPALRPAPRAVARRSDADLRGCERVLVVEPDEQLRAVALRALSDFGYRACGASNATSALTLLVEGGVRVDLILCDTRDDKVEHLAEHARAKRLNPLWLHLSDDSAPTSQPFPTLVKPFTPHTLLETVRDVLASREPAGASIRPSTRRSR